MIKSRRLHGIQWFKNRLLFEVSIIYQLSDRTSKYPPCVGVRVAFRRKARRRRHRSLLPLCPLPLVRFVKKAIACKISIVSSPSDSVGYGYVKLY
ncbi:hypothetical protein H6G81_02490 [Scytonema hofmannii FACHB-248]|uniref:Uncharacterized protein n=1 Tax=Scytonema hofmannii FACHB-248 TaxID=1842502 RepID=A0ABR8GJP6_9CYAN|nr:MULTISPECIES: hypothetical protein [Nostocales]MBD2603427.1 hypothetical protein [Scytonema hofmannii FACHB-248]